MTDVAPPPPTGIAIPTLDVGTGADLAWLLNTGAVRGKGREQPVTMLTGVAGTVSGSLVPVTFPDAGGGGFTVSLPWINEPPNNGDNVLVAHIGQARVVIGPYLRPADTDVDTDVDYGSLVYAAQTTLHMWVGGVTTVPFDSSGNATLNFDGTTSGISAVTFAAQPAINFAQGASGGAPIAVNIGTVFDDHFALHASGLEGTVVPSHSFLVSWGALGHF